MRIIQEFRSFRSRWRSGDSSRTTQWRKEGYLKIEESREDDVFICGFPRSGNTWFQNLCIGVVFGLDGRNTPDKLIQELVPDVHDRKFYKRFTPVAFFKSHHLPQPQYRRVVHLVRDGRDAMVSYFDFLRNEGYPVDMHAIVQKETIWPGTWHAHTEQWLANPHGAEILRIKYEDLMKTPEEELRRFCEFTGMERDDECLRAAVRNAAFQVMREKEIQARDINPGRTPWAGDKTFIRRGVVGSHRDEMPRDVLQLFLQKAGPTLQRLGYL